MTTVTIRKREGDLELSHPFPLLIPKPANKTLPPRTPEDLAGWLTKVDRLARQEHAVANYTASCWYFAAALEPCMVYSGAADINTLYIEQFLAQNLFDNDRQQDALKLFEDILVKCSRVRRDGGFNSRYEAVVKSGIGWLYEYARGCYQKRKFGEAKVQLESALIFSRSILGTWSLTTELESKLLQATAKEAASLQHKSVVSQALNTSKSKKGDKKENVKAPPSPKVKVTEPPEKSSPSDSTVSKDHKAKEKSSPTGSRSPSPKKDKEKLISPDQHAQPSRPPTPSKSPTEARVISTKFSDLPNSGSSKQKPAAAHEISTPKANKKDPGIPGHLQVPNRDRASSEGGKPRIPDNRDGSQPQVSRHGRRNSFAGASKPVVYGKTFDAEESDGRLIKLDNFKVKEFDNIPKSVKLWSSDRLPKTHDFIFNKCRSFARYEEGNESRRNKRRVRIAVLDTGIDMSHPEIDARKDRIKGFLCQIKGLEAKANEDTSGHGTSTALLLMQIAPEADIYVARVFKETQNVVPDQVAPAVEYAISEWQVDIISMSFGFPSMIPKMDAALKLADSKNILLFAAASNDGANEDISRAWPARDDTKVFCIHATNSVGSPWDGNPPSQSATANLATLGVNVLTAGKKANMVGKTGTSIATPIAAATAALLIDFARIPRMKGKQIEHVNQVGTFQGMRKLLLASSTKIGETNFRYIKPWHLFSINKYEYDSVGASIQTELRKFFG